MKRSLWKRVGYQVVKLSFWVTGVALFRFRWKGKEFFPTEGGALICGNHQSYFDPVLVGICFRNRLNFLARKTLFDSLAFGGMIRYLDAIPIDRDGMSLGGIKETLKRLKRGEIVVVFPEGTRTEDGQVGPLKPGFIALARRGKVPILPVAVDGAYDAWPRSKKLPRLFTKICTVFGPRISIDEIAAMSDDQLMETLRERIIACHQQARAMRGIDDSPK
jgi:1-acyl-sn-glycerol-3-phosphate acyltransferase